MTTVSKVEMASTAKRRTLKAIQDMLIAKNVTRCNSFDDYLNAVA